MQQGVEEETGSVKYETSDLVSCFADRTRYSDFQTKDRTDSLRCLPYSPYQPHTSYSILGTQPKVEMHSTQESAAQLPKANQRSAVTFANLDTNLH